VNDAPADDARQLAIAFWREVNGVCFEQVIMRARQRRKLGRGIAKKCTRVARRGSGELKVLLM
jgi:hypothetical protein